MPYTMIIKPMSRDFLLWRCLHGGPLSRESIKDWSEQANLPWERYRARNLPLLDKLTELYGACGIVAWDGDMVAGTLRFYPKAVWDTEGAGGLCLQQDAPNGPVDSFASMDFPPMETLQDRTLQIHCLMVGVPNDPQYKRRGIGSRMVRALIDWAGDGGWSAIQVNAFEDIPILYDITGSAGVTFWNKLGFTLVDRHPHPHLQERNGFVELIEKQAQEAGLDPERAKDQLVMRLDL